MKYSDDLADKIGEALAEDNYTVDEICTMFGIGRQTYFDWKRDKPYFSDCLKKGEERRLEVFKKAARNALLTLLEGKQYIETTTEYKEQVVGVNEDGSPRIVRMVVSEKVTHKTVLPHPLVTMFTNKNLDKANFEEKSTGDGTMEIIIKREKKQ